MYIPKAFITALATLDALMQLHHPELVELDRALESEKEWEAKLFSISRAPPPIRPIRSMGSAVRHAHQSATRPISTEDYERRRELHENIQRVDAGRQGVVLRLREAFAEEELQATIIMPTGTTMVLGKNLWLPDEALDCLAQGNAKIGGLGEFPVLLPRSDFEAWIKTAEIGRLSPAAQIPAPQISNLHVPMKDGDAGQPLKQEALWRSGAPGRPSSMQLVVAEFRSRKEHGHCASTLRAESEQLASWFAGQHPAAPRPTARTIENNIRAEFRDFKTTKL